MADTILVVVEQREGKLNRVSWETLVAGQSIAAETGWALEAAVIGGGVGAIVYLALLGFFVLSVGLIFAAFHPAVVPAL